MTTRRGFLAGVLAAAAAPAIVRASSLMQIRAPSIILPPAFGVDFGASDITMSLQEYAELDHAADAMRYAMRGGMGGKSEAVLTLAMMRRAINALKREHMHRAAMPAFIVSPEWFEGATVLIPRKPPMLR